MPRVVRASTGDACASLQSMRPIKQPFDMVLGNCLAGWMELSLPDFNFPSTSGYSSTLILAVSVLGEEACLKNREVTPWICPSGVVLFIVFYWLWASSYQVARQGTHLQAIPISFNLPILQ